MRVKSTERVAIHRLRSSRLIVDLLFGMDGVADDDANENSIRGYVGRGGQIVGLANNHRATGINWRILLGSENATKEVASINNMYFP